MAICEGLQQWVNAQDAGGSYRSAMEELDRGRKVGHWMWWVFPQLAGLGASATSRRYAIADLAQARAYLGHPVLGPRLCDASAAALGCATRALDAEAVLGGIDAVKLRSSMTLFEVADPGAGPWAAVLDAWYGGERDGATLRLLGT